MTEATVLRWQCEPLAAFSPADLHAVLAARVAVFVVEQRCAYQDPDDLDLAALHLVAWTADGSVAGCLRLLAPGARHAEPVIGRLLTTAAHRRCGLGRELMTQALAQIARRWPGQAVRISAQTWLEDFYRGYGFVPVAPVHDEDGIPHVEMLRPAG